MKKAWFETWFDSPYYHLLYKNHDEQEARRTVDYLLQALDLPDQSRILDLGCGKGRHARYLAEKGFDVTGIDISNASITYARQFENDHLAFYRHDMRQMFRANYFDAVMNMFTSFGYFQSDSDHFQTIKNVSRQLKPGGLLLIDFFNAAWVRSHLVRSDIKTVKGIEFHQNRSVLGNFVFKKISFVAEGRRFTFREKVRLLTLEDFTAMFASAGMSIRQTFGSYTLEPFEVGASRRLIIIASKPGNV
jgi:SAM-dependent methyltransferase